MVQRRGKAENESGLKRAAAITGAVLLFAWVAKSVIWKQGTAEFEELEQRKQAKLDEVRETGQVVGHAVLDSVAQLLFFGVRACGGGCQSLPPRSFVPGFAAGLWCLQYFRFADQRTKPAVDWSSVEEAVEREEALLEAARSRA
jgi:hypothetical protein